MVLYTDDVQLLYQIDFYMTSVPIINQTNRYILTLLNTDDINYTMNEDLKFMYLCVSQAEWEQYWRGSGGGGSERA